jgi:hypothetical protein
MVPVMGDQNGPVKRICMKVLEGQKDRRMNIGGPQWKRKRK